MDCFTTEIEIFLSNPEMKKYCKAVWNKFSNLTIIPIPKFGHASSYMLDVLHWLIGGEPVEHIQMNNENPCPSQ